MITHEEIGEVASAVKAGDDANGALPTVDGGTFTPSTLRESRPDYTGSFASVWPVLWTAACSCGWETELCGYRSDAEYDLELHQAPAGHVGGVAKTWRKAD